MISNAQRRFKKMCKLSLTLTLTTSNYYMSPLSLSACFPTDVSRHVMYSLPNPSESERPFLHWQLVWRAGFARTGQEGGGMQNGTERIAYAVHQGRHSHWPRRSHDPKGPVPRRLFFAALQRIAITLSPKYYQKNQCFITRKNQEEHGPDVM